MYQVKQGHRVIVNTTTIELAEQRAAQASANSQTATITEHWQETGERVVADYFDGQPV
jgi:predicted kinase